MFKPIDLFPDTLKSLCDFVFFICLIISVGHDIYECLSALSKPCTRCSTAEGHPVCVSPPLYISLFCDFHNIIPLMIKNAAVHKMYGQGKGMLLWVTRLYVN